MGRGSFGCGRKLEDCFPTSLAELPIQLRHLRNNQKSLSTYFLFSIKQNRNRDFWTWTSVSKPLEPVLGRKFHVDSEFEVQNNYFKAPEGKN